METILKLENLTKHFGGVSALDRCSFSVAPQAITALVGPNGAGKTTAFNCIAGVHAPDAGAIEFAGRDITHLPIHTRARIGLSRTFQTVRTFHNMTVEENLRLAAEPYDQYFWRSFFLPHTVGGGSRRSLAGADPRSLKAATTYQETSKKTLEDTLALVGLTQPLDFPAKSLSYGQSKLLSLARALLQPHTILMLDEPVAGVAPTLRDKFKTLLPELKSRGETILLIEHDMDFVRAVADRVIVMDQGRVLAEGTPTKVFKEEKVLEAYLGEQI